MRMKTEELIQKLHDHPRSTEVLLMFNEDSPTHWTDAAVYGQTFKLVIGEWDSLRPQLQAQKDRLRDVRLVCPQRQSAWPLLAIQDLPCRIEPGAWIRDAVEIGKNAVILTGAVINVGAQIGAETMVDMNAVIGARAEIGQRCHIGAGAVVAGVLEPASAEPVVIGDDVLIGANAVILEGVRIGHSAVVAAGAVVTEDVPPGWLAAGVPARLIKRKDEQTRKKTEIVEKLRDSSR